jgi:type II secretory pathway pseudopilin PulG
MLNRQRGITLIEIIGAIAIGSAMMLGLSVVVDNSLEDMKGQQAALYQSQLAAAARKYLAANYAQLAADAVPGSTLAITVATLQAGGFLSGGFSSVNPYGQTPCVLVRRNNSSGIQVKLDGLVVNLGGTKILDKNIPAVAMGAGPESGYINTLSPTLAQGASWQIDTTPYRGTSCGGMSLSGTAADGGHLVSALFYDGPGQLSTDFVYRDAIPGHPELNQLNTPLLMAQNALVTKVASCGTSAGQAIDAATRAVLSCGSDGTWQEATPTQWKEPVAAYADLPVDGSKAGDVRMVSGLNRAFAYDGSNWVALAVDQNGNFAVPGTVAVGQDVFVLNNVTVANLVQADSVHGVSSVRGGYLKSDNFTQTGEINLYHYKNPGDACNIPVMDNGVLVHAWPIGTVLLSSNNLPLVCASDAVFRYANGGFSP